MPRQATLYTVLIIATFSVSWAAILFKLAGSGPLPAAFYRLALASVILAIPAIPKFRKTFIKLSLKEKILLLLSGLSLGLHFAFWVSSLFYTSISNSVIIVATHPIWVMIMEIVILKIKIRPSAKWGMLVALIGMVVITQGDFGLGREYIIGDLMALAGALFAGVYFLIGRVLRAKMDNLSYIFPVYLIAAIVLLIMSLAFKENLLDYPAKSWIIFLLLAIIPTIFGHSLYNWLLKFMQAHNISISALGEPVGAAILAIFFFEQIPGWSAILGGSLILAGIFVVLKKNRINQLGRNYD
jgi:drug/metabolite transporter (DMT)-like permease